MKVLSINLATTWNAPRRDRLRAVADFVLDRGVDVVLFQEGVRSCYFYDTGKMLNEMVGEWNLVARSAYGWPIAWESRVGIISRYRFISTDSLYCEIPQTEFVDAIPLPWSKRAVAATVDVPDLGICNIVSVHLSSSPARELDRTNQLDKVWHWDVVQLPPADVRIIGGDFNQAMSGGAGELPDYIIATKGTIINSEMVFTDHFVSDHSGVLVEIGK